MKLASALGRLWKLGESSAGRSSSTHASLFAPDPLGEWLLSWCRLLNAFPDVELSLALPEAVRQQGVKPGQWIHARGPDGDGYILIEEESGRYSASLPEGVRPEEVVELQLDAISRTPAKEQLKAYIANTELALNSGRNTSAARLLAPARQLLDWAASASEYDRRIEVIVRNGLQQISPLKRSNKLSANELVSRTDFLAELLNTLVKDAGTCYGRFVAVEPMLAIDSSPIAADFWSRFPPIAVDSSTYSELLMLRAVLFAIKEDAKSPKEPQFTFVDETMFAFLDVMKDRREPGARARGMANIAAVQAIKQGREHHLQRAIDSLQDEGETYITGALELGSTDHGLFFDLLCNAVPPIRAAHELTKYVDEAYRLFPKFASPSFRKFVKKARHALEEKRVRLSDSLTEDAEDIAGMLFARNRQQVVEKMASEGAAAAALQAAHFTTHKLLYPRSMEPYLLGEKSDLQWKLTWTLNANK